MQIGNVPQIKAVKEKLDELKSDSLISDWELPYENLLTRLDAALFFLTPKNEQSLSKVWEKLSDTPRLCYQRNEEKSLSKLEWQITFNAKERSED